MGDDEARVAGGAHEDHAAERVRRPGAVQRHDPHQQRNVHELQRRQRLQHAAERLSGADVTPRTPTPLPSFCGWLPRRAGRYP